MNQIQNGFLGCTNAIIVETQEQFEKLKEFIGIKNLFLSDGTPAAQLNLTVDKRIAFYRDEVGMFVGYDHPANIGMNYSLKEFNEAFNEQLDLFGDSSTGIVQQPDETLVADEPIDAEVKEVENEISLKEALNQLTIGTITPAKCDGSLIEMKDKVIEIVKKKENILVTKENFTEVKEVVTDLNGKARTLKDQRAAFNKEIKKFTEPFSNAFSEVINTLENVSKSLNENIKVFENEEKQALKNSIYEKTINSMLDMLVSKEMIDEDVRKQFEFKEQWLNKTSFTKSGDFVKKVRDEMNVEFERLVTLHQQHLNDIATIESTVKQLSLAHKLDAKLRADTYIELYKSGVAIPHVNERINQDIAIIKKTVDEAVEKKTQNIQSQPQMPQDEQQSENIQNVADTKNVTVLADEKTGEVVAKGDEQKMMVLVGGSKTNTNIYQYVYNFSGDVRAMTTFNRFIKLLAKMFNFKAERILQVKNDEHIKLINDFKERAGK